MSALLVLEGVALVRGGRLLFEDLDLALEPGDLVQVSGPNGSGKSSLLRLAAGLLRHSAGTIERSGAAALADDNLALDRELALGKALAFWSQIPVAETLAAVGLAGIAEVPVRLLSSGQRKRATLARVFGSGAPLWLLDEPLNALDIAGAAQLAQVIGVHRGHGGAVIAASHLPLSGDWRQLELGQ